MCVCVGVSRLMNRGDRRGFRTEYLKIQLVLDYVTMYSELLVVPSCTNILLGEISGVSPFQMSSLEGDVHLLVLLVDGSGSPAIMPGRPQTPDQAKHINEVKRLNVYLQVMH